MFLFCLPQFSLVSPPAAKNIEVEPDIYTQAYVDKHFPSWDVGIVGFEAENDSVFISLVEKKYLVETLAILRI